VETLALLLGLEPRAYWATCSGRLASLSARQQG